jgi:hypothetical protein
MSRRALALSCTHALAGLAPPAAAQQSETDRGGALMQQGAELLLRGLLGRLGPQLDDLRRLEDVARQLGDLSDYQLPEILPNGDILIRRKSKADTQPLGAVDL